MSKLTLEVAVSGGKRGHRGKIGRRYGEMGAGDGVAAPRGRMSGLATGCPGCRCPVDTGRMSDTWIVDELEEHRGQKGNSGQNSDEFVDGNCGRGGEKLDPLDTKQILGSNPTKLQHTNKSQKKLGLFLWGIFELGTKSTKN